MSSPSIRRRRRGFFGGGTALKPLGACACPLVCGFLRRAVRLTSVMVRLLSVLPELQQLLRSESRQLHRRVFYALKQHRFATEPFQIGPLLIPPDEVRAGVKQQSPLTTTFSTQQRPPREQFQSHRLEKALPIVPQG